MSHPTLLKTLKVPGTDVEVDLWKMSDGKLEINITQSFENRIIVLKGEADLEQLSDVLSDMFWHIDGNDY